MNASADEVKKWGTRSKMMLLNCGHTIVYRQGTTEFTEVCLNSSLCKRISTFLS